MHVWLQKSCRHGNSPQAQHSQLHFLGLLYTVCWDASPQKNLRTVLALCTMHHAVLLQTVEKTCTTGSNSYTCTQHPQAVTPPTPLLLQRAEGACSPRHPTAAAGQLLLQLGHNC